MVQSSNKKKRIFFATVFLLILITMTFSATIAYLSFIDSQKEESTKLYTGTLEINYIDGVYIRNPVLRPMNTVNFNTKDKVYRNSFSVRSTGTLDQKLKIDLNVNKNEFMERELKYIIYNQKGHELSTGFVPKSGKINLSDDLYLDSNDTVTYTLIIWLDDKNYNQNVSMGKTISGSINVTATQIKY